MKRKTIGVRRNLADYDRWLALSVVALLAIGTLLVYAATRNWFASQGLDPQYYLKRHILNIIIGVLLSYGTTLIDYRLLRAYTPILWGLGVLSLIAVLVPGVGSTINGAKSWIAIPGGFQLQPAELAKISVIIGMSMLLAEGSDSRSDLDDRDVLRAIAIAAIPMLLIIMQPDLGEVLIISASVISMISVSGAKSRWVVGLLLLGVLGSFVAVKSGVIHEYQLKRLQSFVNPTADPQQSGYQLRQSRITIGSLMARRPMAASSQSSRLTSFSPSPGRNWAS